MGRRVLRALDSQIARGRLIYEMNRDGYSHLRTEKISPSRQVGGDRGRASWESLPVDLQEHFIRIGDALAKLVVVQQAGARKTA